MIHEKTVTWVQEKIMVEEKVMLRSLRRLYTVEAMARAQEKTMFRSE